MYFVTIDVPQVPFSRVESPVLCKKPSERGLLVEFFRRGKMRQIEEKASERGVSVHVSGPEEAYFEVFCHISRLEILRAAALPMSYLIVNLLFR